MKILTTLQEYVASFDKKEIRRFSYVYFLLYFFIIAGIIVYYVYSLEEMKSKISLLNKSRKSVQSIFTQYQGVKQQKQKVDEALSQNKNFNILRFFQDIVQKRNLTGQTTTKLGSSKLPNGYIEESLQVTINQIDTKILSEILLEIQQETIVYTVSVDITKQNFAKKINLSMVIATLRAEEQNS